MKNYTSIIRAVANGDRQAFKELYSAFSSRVFNTAIAYTRNQEDAEEIVQDVFVKVYQAAAKFRGDADVGTWLYRITINTATNFLKKRNRQLQVVKELPDGPGITFNHPGVQLENQEAAAILLQMIEELPEQQKTAMILSFVERLPRKEVAHIMQTSLKSVESLLQRGKKKLREHLQNKYPNRRI